MFNTNAQAAAEATASEPTAFDSEAHSQADYELLYQIYMDQRIQSQISFYESRVRENQINADFTFTLGAVVMGLSSLVATISATTYSPWFSLLSAILPSLAALLASFRQLYGWERQIAIYRDALMGLERVKLLTPDLQRRSLMQVNLNELYPQIVRSGETVFTAEVNQWGQFVTSPQKAEASEDLKGVTAVIGNMQLTDQELQATFQAILAAAGPSNKPTGVSVSRPTPGVLPGVVAGVATTAAGAAVAGAAVAGAPPMSADAPDAGPPITTDAPEAFTPPMSADAPFAEDAATWAPPPESADAPLMEDAPTWAPPMETAPMSADAPLMEDAPTWAPPDIPAADAPPMEVQPVALDLNSPPPPETFSVLAPGALHVEPPPQGDFPDDMTAEDPDDHAVG